MDAPTMMELNPNGCKCTIEAKEDLMGNVRKKVTIDVQTFDVTELPYLVGKCESLVKGEEV